MSTIQNIGNEIMYLEIYRRIIHYKKLNDILKTRVNSGTVNVKIIRSTYVQHSGKWSLQ